MKFARDNTGARKRSANGHKAKAAGNVVMVDGKPESMQAIADRLGIERRAVSKRLKAAQALDGPVSWARLEGKP